jgi:hypothetical protein
VTVEELRNGNRALLLPKMLDLPTVSRMRGA